MPTEPPVARCVALEVGHGGRALLPPIDLELRRGELLAVLGRNGSGKTTWFRTLLGLLPPVRGRIEPARRPVYLAQRMAFDELYALPVTEVVGLGLVRDAGFLGPRRRGDRAKVLAALEAVGAADLADRTFRSLSEGQKQRVLFARMSASGADLALLDEPTAAMDRVAEASAMALVDRLRKAQGMTVVVVTHHLSVAHRIADRVLFLDRDSPAVVLGTPAEVFSHPAFDARYGDVVDDMTDA